ncbi:MAG: hypothetical protein B6D36_00490 [Planctomycetes bacterium UTPLA1]|nr:MAG: hypothetical protein B6D36_00490 [Planctomycetes bacterium UTPLA1]
MTEYPRDHNRSPSEVVPGLLPPLQRKPPPIVLPIRTIWLPTAIFGLWFAPKRFGPRFNQTPLLSVILTSLVCTWFGLGLLAYKELTNFAPRYGIPDLSFTVEPPTTEMTLLEVIRAPFSSLVLAVHALIPLAFSSFLYLAISVLIALSPILIAALLMPVIAAGESLGRLFRRCIILSLLSLTMTIPIGIIWSLLPKLLHLAGIESPPQSGLEIGTQSERFTTEIMWVQALGIAVFVWWLIVLVRSGLNYSGPSEGPGWAPQTPKCMKCGYILAGLGKSSTCPECAVSVQASLDAASKRNKFTHWNAFKLALHFAMTKSESK